jgi:ribosomal protein L37AE/L43A
MSYEQSEQDIREIERAHELPPDELYPHEAECPVCGSDNISETAHGLLLCGDCDHEWDS